MKWQIITPLPPTIVLLVCSHFCRADNFVQKKQLSQLRKLEVSQIVYVPYDCAGLNISRCPAGHRHQPRSKQLAELASYIENFAPPLSSGLIYYHTSSPLPVQEQKTITYVVYISRNRSCQETSYQAQLIYSTPQQQYEQDFGVWKMGMWCIEDNNSALVCQPERLCNERLIKVDPIIFLAFQSSAICELMFIVLQLQLFK